jgi:hypothetical protein
VAPLVVWVLVAFVVVPQFQQRDGPSKDTRREERISRQVERAADALVKPGQVMLADDYAPVADVRLYGEVASLADYMPPHRYRVLADTQVSKAPALGLHPRYYAGRAAVGLTKRSRISLAGATYLVRPIRRFSTDEVGVAELLAGPGVR